MSFFGVTKVFLGLCCLTFVFIGIVVNALFMLVSPRAWYRLPKWFRASGGLSEEEYSRGWGAVQVRIAGAIGLAMTAWAIYAFLSKHL
jgi:hypothetical protein